MALFEIQDFNFKYPTSDTYTLKNINLSIQKGAFITLCGGSGSGKTTLMRQLKPHLAPEGDKEGVILFNGKGIEALSLREQAQKIGYVLQNPDNQIVTDKVWHELAFGLESLGYSNETIRLKVGEMATFFGIQEWFHKKTTELSGGQKQLLNLASIMVMGPEVIILDEPTSQLDPIGASNFLETLKKINQEIGTTVIITEHRLEEVMPISDQLVVLDDGKVIACDTPKKVGNELYQNKHYMFTAMPAPMQIMTALGDEGVLTIREGRSKIEEWASNNRFDNLEIKDEDCKTQGETAIRFKDVYYKYEKKGVNILENVSFEVKKGEFFAILGGNGTGKTTTLNLINKILKPNYGKIQVMAEKVITLPQNPQALFVKKNVREDLFDVLSRMKIEQEEKEIKITEITKITQIQHLLEMHPYDLSGGEQQRVALAKTLLLEPEILLLDEPTKGLDAFFKQHLAEILRELLTKGMTIVMVSHDLEFCGNYVDRCGMFFDKTMISEAPRRTFFCNNHFYTTSANRMTRGVLKNALTVKEVIQLCQDQSCQKELG